MLFRAKNEHLKSYRLCIPLVMGAALVFACAILGTACASGTQSTTNESSSSASDSQDSATEEASKTVNEGVDTACTATFAPYEGAHADLFLKEGDRIAVIAPSAVPTKKQVDATMKGLKEWGYEPVAGSHVYDQETTLSNCLEDLTWALDDTSIKAIFCVRGGYGASEVQDLLPLERIAAAHKLIIGYSDITVFHAAWTTAQLPSLHTCMSATFGDFPQACTEAEQKIMRGEIPSYTCASSKQCKQGEAEGILIGGNLCTFTSVLGTAYDCTQTDKPYILFFEEVAENTSHVHRYLTILKHLGVLERAQGIVFGEWVEMPPAGGDGYNGNARGGAFASMADMIEREILPGIDVPVAFGFPAGHGENNYPLLMGETAHLSVNSDTYTLSWT